MTPSHRETIENWLVGFDVGRGTPLRSATYRAGEYFKTEEPYRDDPTSTTSSVRSCRQNYHLLFSDGGWTADRGYHTSDVDGTRASLAESDFEITDYTPIAPYTDDVSGSLSNRGYLADQTFYYWVTDLRTGTDTGSNNDVPARIVDRTSDIDFDGDGSAGGDGDIFWNPANNPARWQHMEASLGRQTR